MIKKICLSFIFLSFMAGVSFSAQGDLDPTFNPPDGFAVYNGAASDRDEGCAIAVQSNGKIVVVGHTFNGTDDDVMILRYNSDGTLDGTFGGSGIVTYDSSSATEKIKDYGWGVALQSDGKIVVVGYRTKGSGADISVDVLVLKYSGNGTLDTTFGVNGVVTYDSGSDDYGYAVALQADRKIIVVGYTEVAGHYDDVLVLRFNSDGTNDTTFNGDGVVTYDGSANSYDKGYKVAIQADAKIVVAGYTTSSLNTDVLVLRYNGNGTLDKTFGGDGIVIYNGSANGDDCGYGVALQPDGKIVVAGSRMKSSIDVLVLRYNGDGTLDSSFGGGEGVATYNSPENSYDCGYEVAVQPDGKIVVVGVSLNVNYDVLVLRYYSNGALDASFGGDGVVTFNGAANDDDYGSAIALQFDGKILAAGYTSNGLNNDVLTMRLDGIFTSVTLSSPNGGEVIPSGTTPYTIQWAAQGEDAEKFKLTYSLDNGITWRSATPDFMTGTSYDWTAPKPSNNKRKCLVKVIGYNSSDIKVASDKSDATFTIEVVKLTSPNGGETLTSGNFHTITWTTNETKKLVEKVILSYTLNNGLTWKRIITIFGNLGAYNWVVPSVTSAKTKCKIKVALKDSRGNTLGNDKSDAVFTISP